jgi:uncharacterized protein YjiS (DUF1127 family)
MVGHWATPAIASEIVFSGRKLLLPRAARLAIGEVAGESCSDQAIVTGESIIQYSGNGSSGRQKPNAREARTGPRRVFATFVGSSAPISIFCRWRCGRRRVSVLSTMASKSNKRNTARKLDPRNAATIAFHRAISGKEPRHSWQSWHRKQFTICNLQASLVSKVFESLSLRQPIVSK